MSKKFKVRDRIQMIRDCSGCKKGEIYILHFDFDEEYNQLRAFHKENGGRSNGCGCMCPMNWKLVKSSKLTPSTMQKITPAVLIDGNFYTKANLIDKIAEIDKVLAERLIFQKALKLFPSQDKKKKK